MPTIKIFTARLPSAEARAEFGDELEKLCIQVMHARQETVQIALVHIDQMLRGNPLLVEVHFRSQANRDAEALYTFMRGIDLSCIRHLGQSPRLRCFAVDQATLSASN